MAMMNSEYYQSGGKGALFSGIAPKSAFHSDSQRRVTFVESDSETKDNQCEGSHGSDKHYDKPYPRLSTMPSYREPVEVVIEMEHISQEI
ncbi:hypothetical protein SERLA73DRAFT_123197 [Serpula lacrymans var. lacrymans S7.3]|uniref:Uncharacterized protein n=2 Tax=Serpula lacrymans var. lacrymans TaxID=341189 RepID=F8PXF9_SERL3|nr:uncharacterized protein SERLADRAFT_438647 [Serpula lacrymans var. lacrymans S7.9]EGN99485.1 hypothetical protein SERLA73DRAFT_123197 [Serpula lacrymans var. lacrymans S7.3]EGO25039.1 hypothetical protein SERLADRAFT_438647 [Serpula lacrymans var. lacrymans S7.9]